ncbi:MAG: Ger(x)C family spore germination protein [Anaerotignaceae bacterium]
MKKLFLVMVISVFMFSGCYDSKDLDERNFVISMAVDKDENEEYKVVMGLAKPDRLDGGSMAGTVLTSTGDTFGYALSLFSEKFSPALYYGHCKTLILSDKILNDKKAVNEVLDTIAQNNEFSLKTVVLSGGENIISTGEKQEFGDGLYIWDFYNNNETLVKSPIKMYLNEAYTALKEEEDFLIPIMYVEDEKIIISGGSVYSQNKIVGTLNEENIAGYLWLTENFKGEIIEVSENGDKIPVGISRNKITITFDTDNKLVCKISVLADGNVMEGGAVSSVYGEKLIKEQIEETLNVLKSMNNADPIGITKALKQQEYNTFLKYENENIMEVMEFEIDVNLKLSYSVL